MKLLDMPCPHGWNNCQECANEETCRAGRYEPKQTDLEVVIKASEISQKVVDIEVKESIHKFRGTWAEEFLKMSPEERMNEFYSFSTQGLNYKEPNPAGPSSPGGGGKCRVPKKPAKKMPEYMKVLGMSEEHH